jgi:hypothetical protein
MARTRSGTSRPRPGGGRGPKRRGDAGDGRGRAGEAAGGAVAGFTFDRRRQQFTPVPVQGTSEAFAYSGSVFDRNRSS